MNLALQLLANGLVNGALYAMLAAGFGLVWRTLRVFHVAMGGVFTVSGYVFHALFQRFGVNIGSAFVLTVAFAAGLGLAFEFALYRPFARRGASAGPVLIASLGVYVAIENLVALTFGNETQTILRGNIETMHVGPVVLTVVQVMQLAIGYSVVVVLWLLISRLPVFTAMWAMGDRPELISVLGLPANALRVTVLVSCSLLTAIAAVLICLDLGTDPHIGMSYVLISAVAVLAGGAGSYPGWMCGAIALAVLQSLVVWLTSARWTDLLTFAFLVAMLVIKPRGLIDPARRVEEQA